MPRWENFSCISGLSLLQELQRIIIGFLNETTFPTAPLVTASEIGRFGIIILGCQTIKELQLI